MIFLELRKTDMRMGVIEGLPKIKIGKFLLRYISRYVETYKSADIAYIGRRNVKQRCISLCFLVIMLKIQMHISVSQHRRAFQSSSLPHYLTNYWIFSFWSNHLSILHWWKVYRCNSSVCLTHECHSHYTWQGFHLTANKTTLYITGDQWEKVIKPSDVTHSRLLRASSLYFFIPLGFSPVLTMNCNFLPCLFVSLNQPNHNAAWNIIELMTNSFACCSLRAKRIHLDS